MRLPKIQMQGVQSLGRASPQAAAQAELAKGAFVGQLTQAAFAISDMAATWMKSEIDLEAAGALAQYQAGELKLRTSIEGRTVISASELEQAGVGLPAHIQERVDANPEYQIPMFEVQQEYYKTVTEKMQAEYSKVLEYDKSKTKFITGATSTSAVGGAKIDALYFDRRADHLLEISDATMATMADAATQENGMEFKHRAKEMLDDDVANGVRSGPAASVAFAEFKSEVDYNVSAKAVMIGIETLDSNMIQREIDKVTSGVTDQTTDQQVKFFEMATDGLEDIKKLRDEEKKETQGIAESDATTAMITNAGFGSPTLNEISQGVLTGKYTEQAGRRLQSTYLAGRKFALSQSRLGIPEPKTNPAVERQMEAALFRLQHMPNPNMTLKQQFDDYMEELNGAYGFHDGVQTGPGQLTNTDYNRMRGRALEVLNGPAKTPDYIETMKDMTRVITGTPDGILSAFIPENERLRLSRATALLNNALRANPTLNAREWWNENKPLLVAEKTQKAMMDLLKPTIRQALVLTGDPQAIADFKFKKTAKGAAGQTTVQIDVEATNDNLMSQYMAGKYLPQEYEDVVNYLAEYAASMQSVENMGVTP